MFCSNILSSLLPLIPLNYFDGLISKRKIVLISLIPCTFYCPNIKNNLDFSLSLTFEMNIKNRDAISTFSR